MGRDRTGEETTDFNLNTKEVKISPLALRSAFFHRILESVPMLQILPMRQS